MKRVVLGEGLPLFYSFDGQIDKRIGLLNEEENTLETLCVLKLLRASYGKKIRLIAEIIEEKRK